MNMLCVASAGQPAYVPHWAQWVPPSASFDVCADQRGPVSGGQHMAHMHQAQQGTPLQPITLPGAYMSGLQQQQQQLPCHAYSPRYSPGATYQLHQAHPVMGGYFGAVPDYSSDVRSPLPCPLWHASMLGLYKRPLT